MALSVVYTTINGMLLHESRGGVETEYVPDPLGSLVKCKSAAGTYTYSAEYWPYGEVQSESGTNPSSWSFVGLRGYFRESSRMFYVRARYLMSDLTRWLSVDPLWPSEPAYGYARATPALVSDPTGLKPPCKDPCQSLPNDGYGHCVALLCSMKNAKDMIDALRKMFSPGEIPDYIKRLIEALQKGQNPGPGECCKQAGGGGGKGGGKGFPKNPGEAIGQLCKHVKGPNDTSDCLKIGSTQDSCEKCCDAVFRPPLGVIAQNQCKLKCATKYAITEEAVA
jgi:RHS repeat-associated protein